jgi:hypothetical protein
MENKGLLFIPDISGFTQFVNETEIDHSRVIIQELLEILINANQIGLEISEIEGDAILFYKFGDSPDMEQLYGQVQKMFCEFHRNLVSYEHRRFCQCKACMAAVNLTLKIITHYGEFTGYNVKNFNKLIGKDIIVAHQLLKNDIPQHEYWLVTDNLAHNHEPAGFAQWMKWNSSVQHTGSGDVPYYYTQLSPLKNELPPDHLPNAGLSEKIKMISVSDVYETGIIELFHATGEFSYRSRWQEGVKKVEGMHHLLPRVGMRGHCIMENGKEVIFYSSYSYRPDRIEFSETDELTNNLTYYTLEMIEPRKTKLTIDYYIPDKPVQKLLFTLTKKKKKAAALHKSISNLHELAKEIKLPEMKSE